ncbi:MAG: zinc-binding dehydrogenase [Methylococcaceae bacterium]|nr:zinc-binding dehydrogenase [Methylococcaceae bacterium]MCI0666695.1 zinc-binding dehydrogenase [Methylococcaceae bacterium]MCI0732914.1 zinc-binding dehydrogenase [Methylococcaceae bacterium]
MKASAIFHTEPGKSECREIGLAAPKEDEVLIESICSAISPGTESMIYRGHMPSGMRGDSVIPSLAGDLVYPFRYGYAVVGRIIECGSAVDPNWAGRMVFVFHPHQNRLVVPIRECLAIPEELSVDDALFLPNMEAALNFVMDADPVFGSRVIIFGLGVVGLLTGWLLHKFPLDRLIAADPLDYRRKRGSDFGLSILIDPLDEKQWQSLLKELFDDQGCGGVDIAFELSGNMQTLNQAIEATGFSGTIVSGSWYGTQNRRLDLGGHFHRRRINIVSSQVSTIHPRLGGRWTKQRRIDLAWKMIRDMRPASLISHRFSPRDCDRAFQVASQRLENALQVIFEYS